MTRKLLFVLFITLIIITIAELGYYIFYSASKGYPKSKNETVTPSPTIIPISGFNPTVIDQRIRHPIQESVKTGETLAMDANILENLISTSKYIRQDVLTSYVIQVTLTGQIIEMIIYDENQQKTNPEIPKFMIVIQGSEKGKHQLAFPQDSERQISVYKVLDEKGKQITIDQLKTGDKILVKIDMDIAESNRGKVKNNWLITKIL